MNTDYLTEYDRLTIVNALAANLIEIAAGLQVVVTITQVSRMPPAMGNYVTVAAVRPGVVKAVN